MTEMKVIAAGRGSIVHSQLEYLSYVWNVGVVVNWDTVIKKFKTWLKWNAFEIQNTDCIKLRVNYKA